MITDILTMKYRRLPYHKLRLRRSIQTLCRVLRGSRSTYRKHFSAGPAPLVEENQPLASLILHSLILHIHADYKKRLGAYKIAYVLRRDYGISICAGRMYRLMKQLQLPQMSAGKPSVSSRHSDTEALRNHLQQNFNQNAPNLICISGITCIKTDAKWYYLCIAMNLYSRKVISWHISANDDSEFIMTAIRKAYKKRNAPYGLLFHSGW